MNLKLKYLIFMILFFIAGCRAININVNSKPSVDCEEKLNLCDECKIQPKSGPNRDLRYGYYYDIKEKKCKLISYSTGPGCIPPPFNTMEECQSCCCK
jgi:hypothetical protein